MEGFAPEFATVGLFAVPLVVPAAFLSGSLVWYVVPDGVPCSGAVVGLVTMVTTYLIATVWLVVPLLVLAPDTDPAGIVSGAAVIGFFGFLFTWWVTLPVGVIGGHVHERLAT